MPYPKRMQLDPRELLRPFTRQPKVVEPSPLAGTKRDRVQRVQVGLFGLISMVLVVALADIVLSRADVTEASSVPEAAPTVAASGAAAPRDPLADAGVVPELPPEAEAQTPRPPQETGDVPPPPPSSAIAQ